MTSNLLFLAQSTNKGEYALGLLCAVAVCVILYALVMAVYFWVRRKNPSAKYWIECLFTVFAMVLSVGFKLAVLSDTTDTSKFSTIDYTGYALSAIYSMIGGLSFEGLPFGVDDIGRGISVCLYYGSSILAGLIVLSVITAKASYEIFSMIVIRCLRRRRSVYVFNSLTEDSLILAKDIANHHLNELEKYKTLNQSDKKLPKPKKALIIFAGNNIPAFSRTDPLCREVMSNSFFYYSLMKGTDTKKSLLTRLGLRRNNLSLLTAQPQYSLTENAVYPSKKGSHTRIAEFYFSVDENNNPLQEKNTADAFDELDAIINDFFAKKNKKRWVSKEDAKKIVGEFNADKPDYNKISYLIAYALVTENSLTMSEQYILTRNDLDYQFFARELNKRIDKLLALFLNGNNSIDLNAVFGFPENSKKVVIEKRYLQGVLRKMLLTIFQVNVINESYLTSLSLIDERFNALTPENIKEHLGGYSDENVYKALILGFGKNGQNALHALYFGGSNIAKSGEATQFEAHVFDKDMQELEGIFAKNHPMYCCYKDDDSDYNLNENEICAIYDKQLQTTDYKEFCKQMSLPKVVMYDKACTNFDFIDFFDGETGLDEEKTKKSFNIIVVAFGSDRFNLEMANTIIRDIKREYARDNTTKNDNAIQCIAVNIRDKENLGKLDWTDSDKQKIKNIVVFPFGTKENLYTFDNILNHASEYEFNTNYNNMSGKIDYRAFDETNKIADYTQRVAKTLDVLCASYGVQPSTTDGITVYNNLIKKIYDVRQNADKSQIDSINYNLEYFALDGFRKESNRASFMYSKIMARQIAELVDKNDNGFVLDAKAIGLLLKIEHDRWSRFHIANGWIYNKKKNLNDKMHNCLLPLVEIDATSYAYDLINVIPQLNE